jgi:hypothetical protein
MHVRLKTLVLLVSPLLLLVAVAYIQWGTVGLPPVPFSLALTADTATRPDGFPAWLRIAHYINLLFLVLLIRSGLQILMDHPRLYGNVHCACGSRISSASRWSSGSRRSSSSRTSDRSARVKAGVPRIGSTSANWQTSEADTPDGAGERQVRGASRPGRRPIGLTLIGHVTH